MACHSYSVLVMALVGATVWAATEHEVDDNVSALRCMRTVPDPCWSGCGGSLNHWPATATGMPRTARQ